MPVDCSTSKARRAAAPACIVLAAACGAFAAQPHPNPPQSACTVRLGVSSFAEDNPNEPIIAETFDYLKKQLPVENFCLRAFPTTELLRAAMRRKEVDFIISSSGLYRRSLPLGAKDLAVVTGRHIGNPNRAEGSVFIVRSSNDSIRSLKDARGAVLAANVESGFSGFLTAVRETALLTSDPKHFFRQILFTGQDQREVLRAVESGRADIGSLKTCLLEVYEKENPAWRGAFRVVNEQHYADFACRASTRLYPNWVFSVMPHVDSNRAKSTAQALLDMPPTREGLNWSIATDFSEVDNLMKDLHLGPFSVLDDWSFEMLWMRFKVPITVLITLLLGGAVHVWRTERLIRKRTAQLTQAHAAERRLEQEARDVEAKLSAVNKTVTIGQMSSMVAHELRQPLAAVSAYARGLERMTETSMPTRDFLNKTLSKIAKEAARANAIVEQVRRYARSKIIQREEADSDELLRSAAAAFRSSRRAQHVIFTVDDERPSGESMQLWVDHLEIDLALTNLLKNAADAALGSSAPAVSISLRHEGGYAVYRVLDNGPALDDDAFKRLSIPLSSAKPEGLGLGLSIVRSIADSHGGSLTLRRRSTGGIEAVFRLPEAAPKERTHSSNKETAL